MGIRVKNKSILIITIIFCIVTFPLVTVFKPKRAKIRNSASEYAMSALKEEPIGTTRIPRIIHQTGKLIKLI